MKIIKISLFFIPFLLSFCGINTDSPVYPLSSLFNPVQSPALVAVNPVETWTTNLEYKMEFNVSYYITNQEQEFLGYNLWISTTSTSAQNPGFGSVLYLPDGVEPSFFHLNAVPSTSNLITQRVTDFMAPPSPIPFDLCEKYYFRLQAITYTGLRSNIGNQLESCAIMDINLCPKGTVCNP